MELGSGKLLDHVRDVIYLKRCSDSPATAFCGILWTNPSPAEIQ